jgi:hypothetical protein
MSFLTALASDVIMKILQWLATGVMGLINDYISSRKIKADNQKREDALTNAKTEDQQKDATSQFAGHL